jgi:hypothetical protein
MHPGTQLTIAVLGLALFGGIAQTVVPHDALAVFSPSRRQAIAAGTPIVELTAVAGADVALIGAVRTTTDEARVIAWFRAVEQLQRGAYIPLIRRFSTPPRIEDLAELALDEEDLEELRDCRPGRCDLKLAAAEMTHVAAAIEGAGSHWQPAAQVAFRQVMLARAVAHVAGGFAAAMPYEDHERPAAPARELQRLLDSLDLPGLCTEAVVGHLREYPRDSDRVESFLFWSKDTLGDAKPIVGITQVSIVPAATPGAPTLIVSTQVYATHYLTASVSVIAVAPAATGVGQYLVYARRSRADLFHGPFGGWLRRIVQKRVRAEGPGVLDGIRRKVEAGPPAVSGTYSDGRRFP